jgi:predicted nuclease of restriction endonuclease-like (RecB) superfamily
MGRKIIDRLSYDLKEAFPEETGFSPRNLKYMRKFAEAWTSFEIVQRTVAQIPWRSNITLLDKLKDPALRLWYAQKTIENGFGKDMLVFQIESQLHKREGNAVNNFLDTLPPLDSDLAKQSFKDPYIFNFLGNTHAIKERELEQKLNRPFTKVFIGIGARILPLWADKCILELGNSPIFILICCFITSCLKCYVVVDLKTHKLTHLDISVNLDMYVRM